MDKKRTARVAGLWYLAMAVSGPIGIMYVPSKVVVAGDAVATAAQVAEHALLVRFGVGASLFCQISFVFLVLALVRLFEGVSARHSNLMKSFVLVAVPIAMVNEVLLLGALEFSSAVAVTPEQRGAIVVALLNTHQQGVAIASLFWGLWLFPFGVLAIRSGFIPKMLGALLIVGCGAYLIDSSVALVLPQHHDAASSALMLPLAVGEISMVGWLLVKGVRTPAAPAS